MVLTAESTARHWKATTFSKTNRLSILVRNLAILDALVTGEGGYQLLVRIMNQTPEPEARGQVQPPKSIKTPFENTLAESRVALCFGFIEAVPIAGKRKNS